MLKSTVWHKKLPRLAPFAGGMKFSTQISPLLKCKLAAIETVILPQLSLKILHNRQLDNS